MPTTVLQPIGKRFELDACTSDNTESRYARLESTSEATLTLSGLSWRASHEKDEVRAKFNQLADEWERDRPRGVDIDQMIMHPAYQRIIGMGPRVVPFILARLEQKPGHWFWALYAITGSNPVPAEAQGRLKEMAAAWLRWGRQQGYKW